MNVIMVHNQQEIERERERDTILQSLNRDTCHVASPKSAEGSVSLQLEILYQRKNNSSNYESTFKLYVLGIIWGGAVAVY